MDGDILASKQQAENSAKFGPEIAGAMSNALGMCGLAALFGRAAGHDAKDILDSLIRQLQETRDCVPAKEGK